jgi:hypothetical protein
MAHRTHAVATVAAGVYRLRQVAAASGEQFSDRIAVSMVCDRRAPTFTVDPLVQ